MGMRRMSMISPEPRTTLCAILRSRNARQHVTRATFYGNLQENAAAQNLGPHFTCASLRSRNACQHFTRATYSKFSLSLNVPKHAWIISLSLALYHPKHNSNSTQIQPNFSSKQLQPEKCDQSFFLFELPFKTPSISQNLLDCIFAFPSNHPRFLKIYSIAIFC